MKNLITTIYLIKSFIGIILLMACFISLQGQVRLVDIDSRPELPNLHQILSDVVSESSVKGQIRLNDVILKEPVSKTQTEIQDIRLTNVILKEPVGKKQTKIEYLTIAVESVYPNPAIDQATIPIRVLNPSNVYLNIYDANGQLIDKIFDGEMKNKGIYNAQVDLSNKPKGIYYYSIITKNQTINGKFMTL